MTKPQVTIVSAQPGFQIVEPEFGYDGTVIRLSLRPLVAWAVTYTSDGEELDEALAHPVGVESLGGEWAIRIPDGTTIVPFERAFEADTDHELVAFFEKEQRQREEAQKELDENIQKVADALRRGLSPEDTARETGLPAVAIRNLYGRAKRLSAIDAEREAAKRKQA